MSRTLDRIAVFCGSRPGVRPEYAQAARDVGRALLERDLGLVYGGGNVGLMGIVADEVLAGGGEVIGVIPRALHDREVAHHGVTELLVVETMHERKAEMHRRSDAVLAMPGGAGTLEEIFEAYTWTQLGFHDLPCGLLNVAGFWDPLVAQLDHQTAEGFIGVETRRRLLVAEEPGDLLDRFTDDG